MNFMQHVIWIFIILIHMYTFPITCQQENYISISLLPVLTAKKCTVYGKPKASFTHYLFVAFFLLVKNVMIFMHF